MASCAENVRSCKKRTLRGVQLMLTRMAEKGAAGSWVASQERQDSRHATAPFDRNRLSVAPDSALKADLMAGLLSVYLSNAFMTLAITRQQWLEPVDPPSRSAIEKSRRHRIPNDNCWV